MVFRAHRLLIAGTIPFVSGAGQTELRLNLRKFSDEEQFHPHYRTDVIEVDSAPQDVCPENFEKSGNSCVQLETAPAQLACLPGWQEGPNHTCVGYSTEKPDKTCFKGTKQYDQCIISTSLPKQLMCRDGFSLDPVNGTCKRNLSSEFTRVCPPGSQWHTDRCMTSKRESAALSCPVGYALNQKVCEKVLRTPLEHVCPPGFVKHPLKMKCLQETRTAPIIECPTGTVLTDGVCAYEQIFPVKTTCPPGELLFGDLCISESTEAPLFRCNGNLSLNRISNLCEGNEVVEPIPECTKGTYFNPLTGQCGSAFKVKQPNLACPPDFHFSGKHTCVRHVQEHPTKYCPPGYSLQSKEACIRKDQRPAIVNCPPGTENRGNICVTTKFSDALVSCPQNMKLEGLICRGLNYEHPKPSCPAGYFGGSEKEPLCIKKDLVKAIPRCPENAVKSEGADGVMCVSMAEMPPNKLCPPGHEASDEKCTQTITEPAYTSCPSGFYEDLKLGRCFASESLPPSSICPVGSKLIGGKCLKQHVRDAQLYCPTGFERSGPTECSRRITQPLIHQCAFGFEYDGLRGVCKAVKVKHEFDGMIVTTTEAPTTRPPNEDLKDLEAPTPPPTAPPVETPPEPIIEIQVTRPVVQKGLVVRNEVITLSGAAADVAAKQKILNAGGSISGDDLRIEYVPSSP